VIWIIGCGLALIASVLHVRLKMGAFPQRDVLIVASSLAAAAAFFGSQEAPIVAGISAAFSLSLLWPRRPQSVAHRNASAVQSGRVGGATSEDLLEAYAQALQREGGGIYKPESWLPDSKDVIKAKILDELAALGDTEFDRKAREVLRTCYVSLGMFVGDSKAQRLNEYSEIMSLGAQDVAGLAERLLEFADVEEIMSQASLESDRLLDELNRANTTRAGRPRTA